MARDRKKTSKNEKKSKITTNTFSLLLFYIEKFTFCQETYLENLVYITFVLQFFCVASYWKCSNKTPRLYRCASVLQKPYFDPKYLVTDQDRIVVVIYI